MTVDTSEYADHQTFVRAVTPFADVVMQLAESGYAARQTKASGRCQPAADSPAMAELAEQGDYAGEWDETPIDTAQTHIGLLLTAGEDAMLTFASVVVADRTPLYAYLPVARAGIECLGLASWLGEPGVGTKERVRRSINERIASAFEQTRLPSGLNPEPERQQRLLAADSLGFERTKSKKGKLSVLSPQRPSITEHVKRVLGDGLGTAIYPYMSAISHGTMWGLLEMVEAPEDREPGSVLTAALTITSNNIVMVAAALVLAHTSAYGGFRTHMGWPAPDWVEARQRATNLIQQYLRPQEGDPTTQLAVERRLSTPSGLWIP